MKILSSHVANLPEKDWFRPIEVAEYADLHVQTIYAYINEGIIEGKRIGIGRGVLRIPRAEVVRVFSPATEN